MRLAWLRRLLAGIVVAGREFGKIPAYSEEGERRLRELRKTAAPPAQQPTNRDGADVPAGGAQVRAPGAGATVRSGGAFSLT